MPMVKTSQHMHSQSDFSYFGRELSQGYERLMLKRKSWKGSLANEMKDSKKTWSGNLGGRRPWFSYWQIYFEAIDLSITSITNQFDQPEFKVYSGLEQLLVKACKGEDCQSELSAACDFYGEELSTQSWVTLEGSENTVPRKGRRWWATII